MPLALENIFKNGFVAKNQDDFHSCWCRSRGVFCNKVRAATQNPFAVVEWK